MFQLGSSEPFPKQFKETFQSFPEKYRYTSKDRKRNVCICESLYIRRVDQRLRQNQFLKGQRESNAHGMLVL